MNDVYEKLLNAVKSARSKLSIDAIVKKEYEGRYRLAAVLKRQACAQWKQEAITYADEMKRSVVESVTDLLQSESIADAFVNLEAAFLRYLSHPRASQYVSISMLVAETVDAFLKPVFLECHDSAPFAYPDTDVRSTQRAAERFASLRHRVSNAAEAVAGLAFQRSRLAEQLDAEQSNCRDTRDRAVSAEEAVASLRETLHQLTALLQSYGFSDRTVTGPGPAGGDSDGLLASVGDWLAACGQERERLAAERDAARRREREAEQRRLAEAAAGAAA